MIKKYTNRYGLSYKQYERHNLLFSWSVLNMRAWQGERGGYGAGRRWAGEDKKIWRKIWTFCKDKTCAAFRREERDKRRERGRRCGGEEAYKPLPSTPQICIMVTFICKQTPKIRFGIIYFTLLWNWLGLIEAMHRFINISYV